MKKHLSLFVGYVGAVLLGILCAGIGTLFFPGIGTVIGFFFGLIVGGGAVNERMNPEKYKMHEGLCPHCGSSVKWRYAYMNQNAFSCPLCKERIVLIDNVPYTPAQAKEKQVVAQNQLDIQKRI